MKLFLKRDSVGAEDGFSVLTESAGLKYSVSVFTDKTRQKALIQDSSGSTVSEIIHKNLVVQYFAVKCSGRFYVLVPYRKECFTFMIYGSTYRFAGSLGRGRFSLFDVDKSPVMTQKKCWSRFGDGYQLEIFREDQELFALSCAVSAAMFLAAAESSTVLSE